MRTLVNDIIIVSLLFLGILGALALANFAAPSNCDTEYCAYAEHP